MKAEIKKILKTPYKPKFEMPQKGEEKNKRSISSARQGEFSSTHLTTFRYQAETILPFPFLSLICWQNSKCVTVFC